MTVPRSAGSGFMNLTCMAETLRPVARASLTAWVMAPKVEPQPTTSSSPSSAPCILTGGISLTTLATFSSRSFVIFSWFSAS
ncbi:MAG TPA: hypothetical protein DCZ93_06400 [Elusimicrobia bacterium]|nr:hypothetical protein [Elusimicrobiota bacterium]